MWAPARFAAFLARVGFSRPASAQSEKSTGWPGDATNTSGKLKPTGKPTLTRATLYRRGLVQNNRNPELAERYADKNLILVKGP
jgi:hypothetical protein